MDEVLSFLQISWLNAIREWQEEFVGNMTSREFVETITRDLLGSCVFVFTPRGEVKIVDWFTFLQRFTYIQIRLIMLFIIILIYA